MIAGQVRSVRASLARYLRRTYGGPTAPPLPASHTALHAQVCFLGDAKSSLGDAKSSLSGVNILLGDAYISLHTQATAMDMDGGPSEALSLAGRPTLMLVTDFLAHTADALRRAFDSRYYSPTPPPSNMSLSASAARCCRSLASMDGLSPRSVHFAPTVVRRGRISLRWFPMLSDSVHLH